MGKYSDEFRAEALACLEANDGNLSATSREIGVSVNTLKYWRDEFVTPPNFTEVRNQKKDELSDIYERVARRYLSETEVDDKAKATSAKDAIIVAATATDKMRLLRGLPTEIIEIAPQIATLIDLMKQANHTPSDVFEAMIKRYHDLHDR